MSDLPLRRIFGIFFVLLSVAVSTLAVATEPMPPALLLAERYRGDIDVSRYRTSE